MMDGSYNIKANALSDVLF
jgi:hypothetical protein